MRHPILAKLYCLRVPVVLLVAITVCTSTPTQAKPPAPDYTISVNDPLGGSIGLDTTVATTQITITGIVNKPVTITPSDGGAGGTFVPPSVTLTVGGTPQTLTYNLNTLKFVTISVTNNSGLVNPPPVNYSVYNFPPLKPLRFSVDPMLRDHNFRTTQPTNDKNNPSIMIRADASALVFDAAYSGHFVTPLRKLKYGAQAVVRLFNVNTVQYKYSTPGLKFIDLHGSSPTITNLVVAPIKQPATAAGALHQGQESPLTADNNHGIDDTVLKADYATFAIAFNNLKLGGDTRLFAHQYSTAYAEKSYTNNEIVWTCVNAVFHLLHDTKPMKSFEPVPDLVPRPDLEVTYGKIKTSLPVYTFPPSDSNLKSYVQPLAGLLIPEDVAIVEAAIAQWNKDYAVRYPGQVKGKDIANVFADNNEVQDDSKLIATLQNMAKTYPQLIDESMTPICIDFTTPKVAGGDIATAEVDIANQPASTSSDANSQASDAPAPPAGNQPAAPAPPSRPVTAQTDIIFRPVVEPSAGVAITNLRNSNFFGKPSTNSSGTPVKIVTEGNSDYADASFGPFVTYTWTNPRGFALGATLGATAVPNIRYLGGPSLVFSPDRQNRFILTAGIAYGNVTRLANGDQIGQPSLTGTVATSPVGRAGRFLSLTWNFSFAP